MSPEPLDVRPRTRWDYEWVEGPRWQSDYRVEVRRDPGGRWLARVIQRNPGGRDIEIELRTRFRTRAGAVRTAKRRAARRWEQRADLGGDWTEVPL